MAAVVVAVSSLIGLVYVADNPVVYALLVSSGVMDNVPVTSVPHTNWNVSIDPSPNSPTTSE